jgi:hypothetical protein
MNSSFSGEVYGANALYAAMIVGAATLLLATLWSPGTGPAQAQTLAPAQQTLVTDASTSHLS